MAVTVQGPMRRTNWQSPSGGERQPSPAPEDLPSRQVSSDNWTHWQALIQEIPFVVPEAVVPDLYATTPAEAFRVLLGALVDAGVIPEAKQDTALAGLLRREELASKGIGHGVAIPHTKHSSVTQVRAAVGYSRSGIDFRSLDERPVHLILLIISPPHNPGEHLRALQNIASLLRRQQESTEPNPA